MVYDYTSVCWGGGHETVPPLAGWKAAPLTSEFAAPLLMNPTWDITLLRVSMFSSPAAKPHVVIYPLMTTLGSERTVVPLSTLLMSDTSKLALMLS